VHIPSLTTCCLLPNSLTIKNAPKILNPANEKKLHPKKTKTLTTLTTLTTGEQLLDRQYPQFVRHDLKIYSGNGSFLPKDCDHVEDILPYTLTLITGLARSLLMVLGAFAVGFTLALSPHTLAPVVASLACLVSIATLLATLPALVQAGMGFNFCKVLRYV
jgi:hypothetical protein